MSDAADEFEPLDDAPWPQGSPLAIDAASAADVEMDAEFILDLAADAIDEALSPQP